MTLEKFYLTLLLLFFLISYTFQENPSQETDKKPDKGTNNKADKETQTCEETDQIDKQTHNQTNNETHSQTNNQTRNETDNVTDKVTDKETSIQSTTPKEKTCDFEKFSYYTQITAETASGRKVCGGSIITSEIVLTSAQCCIGISKDTATVYFGYDGNDYELKRKVTNFEMHPYFATLDPRRIDMTIHDACLLTIDTPVDINEQFTAVEIGTYDTMVELFNNTDARVEIVGYGLKYSPDSKPHNENPVIFHCENSSIMPSTDCGFTKEQCDGKFIFCTGANYVFGGSPVVYKYKLVGLITFEGKDIMYHNRIDTIRKWLELKGLSGSDLICVELKNNVILFVIFIKFLI